MAIDSPGAYWLVRQGGLGWLGAPAGAPSGPAEKPPTTPVPEAAAYNALHNHSGLFLSLVESDPDPDSIERFLVRFATRAWGRRSSWPVSPWDLLRSPSGTALTVESWVAQAREMKRLVELWRMVRDGHRGGLHNHIRWRRSEGGPEVVYDPREYVKAKERRRLADDRVEVIASPRVRPEWLTLFRREDVLLPAMAFLQAKVNQHLAGKVRLGLLYDLDEKRLRLRAVPEDLLTALWLQFAEAIEGAKDYRQCKECGAWFEVSPEVARTNRRFCSNACRSRMYRQRQGRAREMYDAGMPLESVAERLDSDVGTVRGWLEKSEKDKGRG